MTITPRPGASSPAAAKSLTRPTTLIGKRNQTDDESSPIPAKREKVTFDETVQVQDLYEWEKAPEVISEGVRRAIQRHAQGDNAAYNEVKGVFDARGDQTKDISPATMRSYTNALLSNVSSLNKSCSDLVHAVLNSEWLGREDDYIKIYVRLVVNVASAQGNFLADVLRMLVENLGVTPPSNGNLPGLPIVPRAQIHRRVHFALRCLLGSIPSASFVLSSVLVNQFPHQDDSPRSHVVYIQNLFQIITYEPALKFDLLSLITDRLVKIDVQVQVDYEDLEADGKDELAQGIALIGKGAIGSADGFDNSGDDTDSSEDTDDEDAQRAKDIKRNANKVDMMLDLLFKRYDEDFHAESAHVRLAARDTLMSQFMTIILPSQRSRHTQFLLFHFAQTSLEFIDTFVGTCISTAFDKKQLATVRQAGAAYLASFVARGVHVPANIVRDVFDLISIELDRLRAQYEPDCRGPSLRRYAPYYWLIQAALYIFCFRWRDLRYGPNDDDDDDDDDDGDDALLPSVIEHQWRPGVKETLTMNIFGTKLNPLKVCQPDLVEQFAEIANHLGVIYVYGLLETNKRIHVSQFSSPMSLGAYGQPGRETALSSRSDDYHHLDAFFPFDPIMLPRSKVWVDGDCRQWTGPPPRPDSEFESDSDDDGAEDSQVEEDTATDVSKDSA